MMRPTLSICIPSFNRPKQLGELLHSIDGNTDDIEIVICEDFSPARLEIQAVVKQYQATTIYHVQYQENEKNLGFDGNIRRLVSLAQGHFVMFMGDDDLFVAGSLTPYIQFLKNNNNTKYVLRAYQVIHPDGAVEDFRYLPSTEYFSPSTEIVAWLFKRSVTICGFTISRDEANALATSDLDGTLLYQVYLMAEICLKYPSAYCDIPIVQAVQSFRLDKPHFGAAEAEKGRYTPGKITADNSINFSKAYFELTMYLDKKHGISLTQFIQRDLSKYSYPFLSIQRKRGGLAFMRYANRLNKELGFGCTPYFYLYQYALLFLGESVCDQVIIWIKKRLGYTPQL